MTQMMSFYRFFSSPSYRLVHIVLQSYRTFKTVLASICIFAIEFIYSSFFFACGFVELLKWMASNLFVVAIWAHPSRCKLVCLQRTHATAAVWVNKKKIDREWEKEREKSDKNHSHRTHHKSDRYRSRKQGTKQKKICNLLNGKSNKWNA